MMKKSPIVIDGDPIFRMNEDGQYEFFFWLGKDGNADPVDPEVFEQKQEHERLDKEDYLNVRTNG